MQVNSKVCYGCSLNGNCSYQNNNDIKHCQAIVDSKYTKVNAETQKGFEYAKVSHELGLNLDQLLIRIEHVASWDFITGFKHCQELL
jgi:hypothetical protein